MVNLGPRIDERRVRQRRTHETGTLGLVSRPRCRGAVPRHRRAGGRTGPDRDAAGHLYRDQSGAGLGRSQDRRGPRARCRYGAGDRQAPRRARQDHGRGGPRRRARQPQERRGRHGPPRLRSGAGEGGRLLAALCAGAEHLPRARGLGPPLGRRRRQARRPRRRHRARRRRPLSDAARSRRPSSSATTPAISTW